MTYVSDNYTSYSAPSRLIWPFPQKLQLVDFMLMILHAATLLIKAAVYTKLGNNKLNLYIVHVHVHMS